MARQKPEENVSFDQILRLVDALGPEERGRIYRHLQLQFWDEEWNRVRHQLDQQRAVQGEPPATDEEVHDAVDAMRSPEDWADLRHEIQKGMDQLDRGEGIPAEQVFAELRDRNKTFRKTGKS